MVISKLTRVYLWFSTGTPHVGLVHRQVPLKGANTFGIPHSTGLDHEPLKMIGI